MKDNRIKELREEKGLTQVKLANELGIYQNTLSRYENGERQPDIDMLIKIAKYFGVSVDYLLKLTDNPKINT